MTQNILKSLVSYDSETGIFTKDGKPWGTVVDTGRGDGYKRMQCTILGKRQYLHRLAWLYVYGEFPKGHIDHKDKNPMNNRIDNLRDVSNQDNMQNKGHYRNSKSGVKGLTWNEKTKRWRVDVHGDGEQIYVGTYREKDEAMTALEVARTKIKGK